MTVLALNCGSSSLKFGLYSSDGKTAFTLLEGEAEEIGKSTATFSLNKEGVAKTRPQLPNHAAALEIALNALDDNHAPQPGAVGHRFVHGGPKLRTHQKLTPEVAAELKASTDFAPLHMPASLRVLDAVQQKLPALPQVICLDTAFHRNMPDLAKTFAFPQDVRDLGVERYGFHGLSLESILPQLDSVPNRLIVAHLGNGASITAIRDGASIDTTMGLTPTGGIMMGTRCGDLDPGVLIYLLRHGYAGANELEDLVDHHSGLLGVSGKTSDVRQLLAARKDEPAADLALRLFCYRVRKAIAAMAAALGGVETLVFTGGIGEHAADLRNEICSELKFLGEMRVLVLPAQEDAQIAIQTARLTTPGVTT